MTFHNVPNYGAALQAYALFKAVHALTDEVEIVDYINPGVERYYRARCGLSPRGLIHCVKSAQKARRIDRFVRARTTVCEPRFSTGGYDALICGSDQIWSIASVQGYDPVYFLDCMGDEVRKLSYAPSANETDSFGEYKGALAASLKTFHALSVRDQHTLDLLRRECGVSACKVLDPTFLVNFDDVIREPKLRHPYLLVYLNGTVEDEVVKLIGDISRARGLLTVAVDGFPGVEVVRRSALGPKEWLGLVKNADYVVTNTFHGTVFSIKYEKPFTAVLSSHKRAKVYDLLGDLELTDTADKAGALDRDIDYSRVGAALNRRIDTSWRYLKEALR